MVRTGLAIEEPQFQKPNKEKALGIKILQWVELVLFVLIVLLFIQFPVNEGVLLLIYIILSLPIFIFSLGFFIYDKGLLKFNLWLSYLSIFLSLILIVFSIFLFSESLEAQESLEQGLEAFIAIMIGFASFSMLILSFFTNRYIKRVLN